MSFSFIRIKPEDIQDNIFKLIGQDWMLITAGNLHLYNTMTASWGFMGILWNKPIAVCFIRPQRFTLEFVEKSPFYTLSFLVMNTEKQCNFAELIQAGITIRPKKQDSYQYVRALIMLHFLSQDWYWNAKSYIQVLLKMRILL